MHRYPGAEFWSQERISAAQAMRKYRFLWAACPEWEQWQLRRQVHVLRAAGTAEATIDSHLRAILHMKRPWRLLDGELVRALKSSQKERLRQAKRRPSKA